MKKSIFLIAAIWVYFVGGGLVQGFTLPTSQLARDWIFPWQFVVFIPLVVIVGAFFRGDLPGKSFIRNLVDQRFGPDTYRTFMKSLKLELLFSSMCFGIGIVGFARTMQLGGPNGALAISGFFASGGVAFLAAYFIGRWHRSKQD